MLETLEARLPECKAASARWTSPVGRSMSRAGASGDEGEVKVYASFVTLTLMSR